MRFVTFVDNGVERLGVLRGDRIIPLHECPRDLVDVICGGPQALHAVRAEVAAYRGLGIPMAEGHLLAPIRRFRRDILCTGWNYADHFAESRGQPAAPPAHPTFFTKGPDTVIGPYDDIAFDPKVSAKWDYEAELAVVIGRAGRSIPRAVALDHVWGYTLANDVSQRDLQQVHGGQWLKGKNIDATMPIGPCVVTADQIGDPQNIQLRCVVNGEVRQDASTRQMAFDVATLISELSFGMTLRPGDLLLTGTPAGVGNAREPQVFLRDGDEVVVRGDRIGELRNRVVHWDLATPSKGEAS